MTNSKNCSLSILLFIIFSSFAVPSAAQSSYISSGHWAKIKVTTTGVFKITYNDLINNGFDVPAIDPRKLTIIGNQGGMMSEINIAGRKPGMQTIAIKVEGENDGVFNTSDFIVAYLEGPNQMVQFGNNYIPKKNIYTTASYYYIGYLDTPAPRVSNFSWTPQAATYTSNRKDFVVLHDTDLVNPQEMGRKWFGEQMGNETLKRNFRMNLPTNADNDIIVSYRVAAFCEFQPGSITGAIEGSAETHFFSAMDPTYVGYSLDSRTLSTTKPSDNGVDFSFDFNRQNTGSKAWIDFLQITGTQPITLSKGFSVIRSRASRLNNIVEYQTEVPASNAEVWEVSNPFSSRNVQSSVGGSGKLNFVYPVNQSEKTFIVFNSQELGSPEFAGTVKKMNLCAGVHPDLLIITNNKFINAANRLAKHREATQNYKVKVVDVADIYHQYNGGAQDVVAIREYIKDEFINTKAAGGALKYAVLMGATSYDMLDRVKNNSNFIPIYGIDSDSKLNAYCIDDFFGYLKDGEGNPAVKLKNELNVVIGRITCRTVEEAEGVVNKLIRYDSKMALGPWRQELAFISDDRDQGGENIFTVDCEKSAVSVLSNHKTYNVQKYYLDAYKQITSGNAQKYPIAARTISETIQGGTLFTTYIGHGGETGWCQERVLTLENIKGWQNPYAMPVLFTATCEFGRYDNPELQSGGELALLNPNGGAIAMLTTTRLVLIGSNSEINEGFWLGNGFQGLNNRNATIGDYYSKLKNFGPNNGDIPKFSLLGDPSMTLAIPKNNIVIEKINNKNYQGFKDTLKAFSLVKIEGRVEDLSQQLMSDFTGTLWVSIFDKLAKKYTQNNDKQGIMEYTDYTGMIFKGTTNVKDGKFTIQFVVPKDISYVVGTGKISLYAHNNITDACGYGEIMVGASEKNIIWNEEGPAVKAWLNDTFFKNGQIVQQDGILIARIYDKDGINTTGSGIGRDIMAVIDANTPNQKEFVLNSYFTYDLNSYQQGTINYNIYGLTPGAHTITIIAFDIFNNPGTYTIHFTVDDKNKLIIYSNKAYPNPFHDKVTLEFEHNFGNQDLTATYLITDTKGSVVAQETIELPESGNRESRVTWDATKQMNSGMTYNQKTNSAMYFYRVEVKTKTGSTASYSGKLIKQN